VGALNDSLSVIEGGEIGSGHSMVAMFEIVPTEINKGAIKDDFTTGKFADVCLQYKRPNDTLVCKSSYKCKFSFTPFNELDKGYRFSAAVAMFGGLLRSSPFTKNISWNDIVALAEEASTTNDLLQKEFIALVQQAKGLYSKVKKRKSGLAVW
jgi:Ca-activated chloride channel family protein